MSELSQTVCSLKNSERNLLYFKYAFCKSLQLYSSWTLVLYISQQKTKEFNTKSCIKILLLEKEHSYTCDCAKQKSKFPQIQNKDLNLFAITLHSGLYAKLAPWLLLLLF